MKRTKTMVVWSLAALSAMGAAGGLLWAQQTGAPAGAAEPPAATTSAPLNPVSPQAKRLDAAEPPAAPTSAPGSNAFPLPGANPGLPNISNTPLGLPVVAASPPAVHAPYVMQAYPASLVQQAVETEDPEAQKLREASGALAGEAEQLVAQYAASEDQEQRAELKRQLAELLDKHFSVQQQLRERELARVEARVKKLRDLTQKRRDAQRTIVEQRLDQLLREADGLGWTPPAETASNGNPYFYGAGMAKGWGRLPTGQIMAPNRGGPAGKMDPYGARP